MLNGFAKKPLKGIPESDLKMVGRYVDHELLVNLENDNKKRLERIKNNSPLRLLLTVGGAGAGFDMFLGMVKHLLPLVKQNKVALFINFGDHKDVYEKMINKLPQMKEYKTFFNKYTEFKDFVKEAYDNEVKGIVSICNDNIFEAVYSTNLLMPVSDLLVTKPSELVYYPIPKVFMRHIGGHEVYGAVNGQELGDSTFECPTLESINQMLDRILNDKEILAHMVSEINRLKAAGYYNGAYECVKLAVGKKNE